MHGTEIVEKLGRNDLCPCGSDHRFPPLRADYHDRDRDRELERACYLDVLLVFRCPVTALMMSGIWSESALSSAFWARR
jgi:hypothetical protein